MCLYTYSEEKIAEHDIPVIKVLEKRELGYFTPCTGMFVPENIINGKILMNATGKEEVLESLSTPATLVGKGFIHTYGEDSINSTDIVLLGSLNDYHVMGIKYTLFKCVIPKGTRYWYSGRDDQYASKSLRFVSEI